MLARELLPAAGAWKRTIPLVILALFAASCGGSGNDGGTAGSERTKVVRGPGFHFTAPAGWHVGRTARSVRATRPGDAHAAVSATVYRLGKPYSPGEFDAAAKELDGVAARLAGAAGGAVTSSETTTVAARKVRAYRFTADDTGAPTEDRVAFVLSGRREVQLLCVAPKDERDPDGACTLLFDTFTLG